MDPTFISQIQQYVKLDEETCLVHKWLTQVISKNESRSVLFLATEFNIFLFFKKENENSIELDKCYPLCDLKKAESVGKLMFILHFKKDRITFVEELPTHILDIISVHLRYIMLPKELPKIDSSIGPDSPSKVSYKAVVRRYRAKMKWNGSVATEKMLTGIQQFIDSEPNRVDLGLIEDLGLDIEIFLQAIEIQPLITTLVIPYRQESKFWPILVDFMGKNSTIRRIMIHESYDISGFKALCSSISKNFSSSLYYIDFTESQIDDSTISSINSLVSQHPISRLTITKCSIRKSENSLMNLMIKCGSVGQLLGISFTSMNLSTHLNLVNACLNLSHVYLKGCGIQISDVLDFLSLHTVANRLSLIDLTHNRCTEPMRTKLRMPVALSKLIVDDVIWNYHNLLSIFTASVNACQSFTLSVARASLDKVGWDKFFDSVESLPAPCLEGLIWRENPIPPKFCSFLAKCPVLAYLSLAGCSDLSEATVWKTLEAQKRIQILDIHGMHKYKLGATGLSLLNHLKRNKTLRRIDISRNKIGPQGYSKLIEFIATSPTIKAILLDGNNLSEISIYESLVSTLQAKGSSITVKLPREDLQALRQSGDLSESRFLATKGLFRKPRPIPKEIPGSEEWTKLIIQQYDELEIIDDPIELSENEDSEEDVKDIAQEENTDRSPLSEIVPNEMDNELLKEERRRYTCRWEMDFVDVPSIDNTSIIESYSNTYNLEVLCMKLQST